MKTPAKLSVIASAILFAGSLSGPGSEFLWGFLQPLSALLFVNAVIMNLLANEYGKYDEEHERRLALARERRPGSRTFQREDLRSYPTANPTFSH